MPSNIAETERWPSQSLLAFDRAPRLERPYRWLDILNNVMEGLALSFTIVGASVGHLVGRQLVSPEKALNLGMQVSYFIMCQLCVIGPETCWWLPDPDCPPARSACVPPHETYPLVKWVERVRSFEPCALSLCTHMVVAVVPSTIIATIMSATPMPALPAPKKTSLCSNIWSR